MIVDDFLWGARCLLRGFGWIRRPGLRRYVIVPLLINLLIFSATLYWAYRRFDSWLSLILPESMSWLAYLLWPIAILAVLVITFYTFTLVANFIGSPFNDRLAEAVARRLDSPPSPGRQTSSWVLQISGALLGELRKWAYFALLFVGLLLIWLFPLTTVLTPVVGLLLSAWIGAFEYLDYAMENAGLSFGEKRRWLRRQRGAALGFGAAVVGATMIPVVNFAVMPAAVAGATELWVRRQAPPGQPASPADEPSG